MITPPPVQPRRRPVIRIFVSSTFSDLKYERNALQAQVFPKLERLCAQNGFQFQAIDLRWGVSSEAGLDHRTMRICFDELRRAQDISPRPNFLILLGNRYGWRPLPEEISVAEFQALERAAAQVVGSRDQPAAAILRAWYRRDENAVPPVYLLQSRLQQLPDAKDYTQDAPWSEVQAILWAIINRAMPPEQIQGRFDAAALAEGSPPAIVRFQASATEQEIWHGALRAPDAHEHVLAFFRQIEKVGEFSEPAQIKDFVDLEPSGRIDAALSAEQERLKDALRKRLGAANVFETRSARFVPARDSQGRPTADVTTDHLAQLCSDVEGRLTQIIRGQIEEYWNKTAQASTERAARELKIEQDEHERFGRERGAEDSFVGRQTELQAILDYVWNDSPWPLVVHGASGCGKTALLARAAGEMQKSVVSGRWSVVSGQKPEVIVRFIGVTPRSSDIRSLLGSLCQELRLRHPREGELPADTKALREELQEQFRSATPEQPLILFLDALDQLSDADAGRLLNWIPAGPLPGHVKLVVSCLSDRVEGDPAGQPCAELRRRQLPAENLINLDVLSEAEARTLLFGRWLHQAGRTVSPDQRERIRQRLTSAACRQPIYLKLLFEEARLWRSYDRTRSLGGDVSKMLARFFVRLRRPGNHGRLLVNRVLGYLAASRHGLAENEILEVLFADPDYKAALDQATEQTRHELPASAARIPIAIWSRLRFDLAPYLTERAAVGANVLTFYHRQVDEWVQQHFAKSSGQSWQPHQRLADYFRKQADPDKNQSWQGRNPRPFLELPFHLIHEKMWSALVATLEDIFFLEAKNSHGLVFELVSDFSDTVRQLPRDHPQHRILCLLEEALRCDMHFVAGHSNDYPQALFQCLWNSCWWHDCSDETPAPCFGQENRNPSTPETINGPRICDLLDSWRRDKDRRTPGFRWVRSLRHPQSGLGTGFFFIPSGADFTDCHLAVSNDSAKIIRADEHNASVWNVATGERDLAVSDPDIVFLEVGFTETQLPVALGIKEGRLRMWNLSNEVELLLFDGICEVTSHLAYAPESAVVIAGTSSGRVQVWSADSGRIIREWSALDSDVKRVAISADGAVAASIHSQTVHLWSVVSGQHLQALEVNATSVAISPDSAEVAIGVFMEGEIRLFDLAGRAWGQTLTGHKPTYPIRCLAYSRNGRWLSSASFDMQVCAWERRTGTRHSFLGHEQTPEAVVVSSDGLLVSGDWNGGVLVRRVKADEQGVAQEHMDWIDYIAFSSQARRIATCSEDASVRVWNADNGRIEAVIKDAGNKVSFAPDGSKFALARTDGTLEVWDCRTSEIIEIIPEVCRLGRHQALAFCPKGQLVAVATDNGSVWIVEWSSYRLASVVRAEPNAVTFSPDGRHLACLCYTDDAMWSKVELYSAESGSRVKLLECPDDFGRCSLVFSPDGRYVLFSSPREMHAWDWQSDRYVKVDLKCGLDDAIACGQWVMGKETVPKVLSMCWESGNHETVWHENERRVAFLYPAILDHDHQLWLGNNTIANSSVNRLEILRMEGDLPDPNSHLGTLFTKFWDQLEHSMRPVTELRDGVFRAGDSDQHHDSSTGSVVREFDLPRAIHKALIDIRREKQR